MESFYRVQDSQGIGPYQSWNNSAMNFAHTLNPTHPSPRDYAMSKSELCGFRSMRDLYAWFGGWLPGLIRDGYQIVKVNGTLRYEDRYQVVFQPI